MKRQDVWFSTAMMLFFLTGSLGCVTQGDYDEIQAERDAFSTRVQDLERTNLEFEEELVALRLRSAAIEEELREEIVAGEIRIDEIRDGIRVDVSNQLLFASGSANLSQKGRDVILRLAKQLREGDEMITVEGHTDNIGSESYNRRLSAMRADSVKRYLVTQYGVDESRIKVAGYGEERPLTSNDTEYGRSQNRRVEIVRE